MVPQSSVGTAILLDGSNGNYAVLESVHHALLTAFKRCEVVNLAESYILPCMGCFACWVKTPGVCVKDDDGRRIAQQVMQSELIVLVTPVTFGGYSSTLKRMVDALIQTISPFFRQVKGEVHHQQRYSRYPALLAIGIMPKPDSESEAIFRQLVARNAVNFHAPNHQTVVMGTDAASPAAQAALAAALKAVMPA